MDRYSPIAPLPLILASIFSPQDDLSSDQPAGYASGDPQIKSGVITNSSQLLAYGMTKQWTGSTRARPLLIRYNFVLRSTTATRARHFEVSKYRCLKIERWNWRCDWPTRLSWLTRARRTIWYGVWKHIWATVCRQSEYTERLCLQETKMLTCYWWTCSTSARHSYFRRLFIGRCKILSKWELKMKRCW